MASYPYPAEIMVMGKWLNTLAHKKFSANAIRIKRHCNVAIGASAVVMVERSHRRIACC